MTDFDAISRDVSREISAHCPFYVFWRRLNAFTTCIFLAIDHYTCLCIFWKKCVSEVIQFYNIQEFRTPSIWGIFKMIRWRNFENSWHLLHYKSNEITLLGEGLKIFNFTLTINLENMLENIILKIWCVYIAILWWIFNNLYGCYWTFLENFFLTEFQTRH